MKQDAFRLACVVADWFRLNLPATALWTAFPAGEHRSAITGARLKRMGVQRGWPDYILIYQGRTFGIELKAPKGKLSEHQKDVADAFTANGCGWTVARTLDEVEAFLIDQGVPLRGRIAA